MSTNETRKIELALYASKFVGTEPKYKTALDAKRAGGKKGKALDDSEIVQWNSLSMSSQHKICISRLSSSVELQNILKRTGSKYLLHQENRGQTPIWGGRIDKNTGELIGQNKLGIVWMTVRKTTN
tara:strand:- start:1277 stop:1654 length:378 start_codon:yes stop_codon:yes gene_type:complete